jgi:hypothetical protein
MTRKFIPFTQVKNQKAIIVDSMHPNGLILSHWRGAPTPAAVQGDTSADIVLNALKTPAINLDYEHVTANHFDVDGFVGVWALLQPDLALVYEPVLRQMALIGDFRELNLDNPVTDLALKLVCWINAREKEFFYPPFGASETEESEVVASVPKFDYFLREFEQVLLHPEKQEESWGPEYTTVIRDYKLMRGQTTKIKTYPGIGLIVVQTPEPVHYYALFSPTAGFDMVLAQYRGNRYELECKYTTWVDIASRPTLPRVALAPLANLLNQQETVNQRWTAEPITDTGPILRLGGQHLTKQERYANPTDRPIYSSGLSPTYLEKTVVAYFTEAYRQVTPRQNWTWEEVKTWNKR